MKIRGGQMLARALQEKGADLQVSPGCPNLIERVEGGLLSYGNEMTHDDNPLECGLERYCQLDGSVEYIGIEALQQIAESGPERLIRGVIFDGEACPACQHPWPLMVASRPVGYVTTAIWSPRFERNVALAMLDREYWQAGTAVTVSVDELSAFDQLHYHATAALDIALEVIGSGAQQHWLEIGSGIGGPARYRADRTRHVRVHGEAIVDALDDFYSACCQTIKFFTTQQSL